MRETIPEIIENDFEGFRKLKERKTRAMNLRRRAVILLEGYYTSTERAGCLGGLLRRKPAPIFSTVFRSKEGRKAEVEISPKGRYQEHYYDDDLDRAVISISVPRRQLLKLPPEENLGSRDFPVPETRDLILYEELLDAIEVRVGIRNV